jgi:UDPglucose 6-dehydrogenase
LADGPYACAEGADALVIVTEWEQFRALDLNRIKGVMKQPVLIDLRNVYSPADMVTSASFTTASAVYWNIGIASTGDRHR